MRKLKLQVQLSLDGFMCGPAGELDWMIWDWDDRLNEYVRELTEPVDHILLGRNLAEGFIPHWQNAAEETGADMDTKKMAERRKTVFSYRLDPGDDLIKTWRNTNVERGDLKKTISKLKQAPGGDLIAYGGAEFVTNLIENKLIDEYHLFYNPVSIGVGKSIFNDLSSPLKLKLTNSNSFDCGIVVNTYINKL
ncbi:MAG TPA: dihydrofolate reductase family protein [Gillisia sp.]|nr:dihydrofolate reductase family protein [Gillisia sp.]